MLTLTYEYKLVPTLDQRQIFDEWLKVCAWVWNFALRERKDWANSRKCDINMCSIRQEYIIPVDVKRPTYASQCKALTAAKKEYPFLKVPQSQVLQQVLKSLETAFVTRVLREAELHRKLAHLCGRVVLGFPDSKSLAGCGHLSSHR